MTNLRSGDARLVRMTPYECWQQLDGSDPIARVVWSRETGPSIVPVNYVVSAGALWFQVSADSALGRECEGQRILIEADHADSATHAGWSVVVSGVAELVDTKDAANVLRDLQVWPSGPRSVCVRLHPDEVQGRRLLPHH